MNRSKELCTLRGADKGRIDVIVDGDGPLHSHRVPTNRDPNASRRLVPTITQTRAVDECDLVIMARLGRLIVTVKTTRTSSQTPSIGGSTTIN